MKRSTYISLLFIPILFLSISSCKQKKDSTSQKEPVKTAAVQVIEHTEVFPQWAANSTMYEVNIRQYTKEGTFKAFEAHLPRLKKMGIDILWLMPVHPIGKVERKGSLGSYYSVSDYRGINPEFGTMADFEQLLDKAHTLGMRVIMDWVPNHTAWDHPWIKEKPDYYTINPKTGKISLPLDRGNLTDWSDVAELNYDNQNMRREQIADLHFWVDEKTIDGFRFDSPHNVPLDFWKQVAASFAFNKELLLLGENEDDDFLDAGYFNCFYAWEFVDVLKHIVQDNESVGAIDKYLAENVGRDKRLRIYYTSNHDENSWQGTVFERLGKGHQAGAVLAATIDGMPLLYSGQESATKKRIKFFERDPIEWGDFPYEKFYTTLFNLKKKNKALWNGNYGGPIVKIPTNQEEDVYAFSRSSQGDKVVVIVNMSNMIQDVTLQGDSYIGSYNNVFANGTMNLTEDMTMKLNAWDYIVLSSK